MERFRDWCVRRTQYSVVGKEQGKQGIPHLQGFHQNSRNIAFCAFHKAFPSVHVQPVVKDNGADEYVQKEGDVVIRHGTYEKKTPGARTDLAHIAELCREGRSMAQIAEECPIAVIQYGTGINRLCSMYEKPRDRKIPKRCICLWGPSEVWKTRRIYDYVEGKGCTPYVWENDMPTWWDGYCRDEHVIMDEFRSQLTMAGLIRLMDRYPKRVPFKGGSCQYVANYMYFTSSKHPSEWYRDQGDDKVYQLLRRFERIIHVTSSSEDYGDLFPPLVQEPEESGVPSENGASAEAISDL